MLEFVRSADGTTIAYERSGVGPALVLVGGAFATRHSFDPLVPLLSGQFCVYAFDRRGRGESGDTRPYSVAREVEDLHAVIAAAGGSAHLYGHSSGGILALEAAAATGRVTRLAVYEPPYLTGETGDVSPDTFAARLQDSLDSGHPDDAVELWMRHTGAGFNEGIKYTPWWPEMVAVAPSLVHDLVLTGDGSVPTQRLQTITARALAIYGGASTHWASQSAAAVAAAIPGARFLEVPEQNHMVAHDTIAPVLIDFFN